MAVGRAFEQAVRCCRAVPTLDVGVHLTLVAERPLLPHGSTLSGDDGRFPAGACAFLRRWLTGRIRRADVQAEWSAQIERVLDHGSGRRTWTATSMCTSSGLADLSLHLAARYNIPSVRVPVEDLRGDRRPSLNGIDRMFGATALRASWVLARLTGAKTAKCRPLRFLGFQDGGRMDDLRLRRLSAPLAGPGV